jgi:membrane fusion protein, multidrug efflux system
MSCASPSVRLAAVAGFLLCGSESALAQTPVPVEVVMPETGRPDRTLELSGSVTPRRAASLSPRASGLVAEIGVDAGDRVRKGDVLLRLDGTLAELAVAEAEATLQESRAALNESRRLRDESRRLVRDNFVSQTEVEAQEAALELAEAAVARSQSQLATARERLARHTVVAPFDGVISRRLTEAGEWVETGNAVAELVSLDELWMDVRAPQQYWSELQPDAAVSIVLDAFNEMRLDALVHARVPVSDPSARTFLVRLSFEAEPGTVTPGMSGRARFTLPGKQEVLRVPRDALIRYPDGTTTVWVVEERDGATRADEIEVTVGRSSGDTVEIVSGLDPLRPVVVRGNEVLSRGQAVSVRGGS